MAQMRDEDARRATKSRGSIERQALHAPGVETPGQGAHAAEPLLAQEVEGVEAGHPGPHDHDVDIELGHSITSHGGEGNAPGRSHHLLRVESPAFTASASAW